MDKKWKSSKKRKVWEKTVDFFPFFSALWKKIGCSNCEKVILWGFFSFFFACYKQAVDFYIPKLPLKKRKRSAKLFVCISTSFQTTQNGKRWVVENSVETVEM